MQNEMIEVKPLLLWICSDDEGNRMMDFLFEEDARKYALKYGYTVGWEEASE